MHTSTHSRTHAGNHKNALFLPPTSNPSRGVHVCICVCVWEGGLKSFLITHLSHEKHSAYFVWALAVWLIQLSSHSNCSLYTKLPLFTVLFYLCLPPFHFLPSFLWFLTFFRLFILVYWCMLARSSSHRGKFLLGDCQCSLLANDDRTIRVERNNRFLAIYVALQLSSSIQTSLMY